MARILICDDEPSLRELMRAALDGDHSFVEAKDGREALELARRERPDVVLLDLMMPGTTGLDALAEIRGDPALQDTPVVVVSAFSGEAERRDAVEAGADVFLPKPFDPDELVQVVDGLLAEAR